MVSIGRGHLDADISFPIKYAADLLPALRSTMQFPYTELQAGQRAWDVNTGKAYHLM